MQNERGKLFVAESPGCQLVKSADEKVERVDIYRVDRDSRTSRGRYCC